MIDGFSFIERNCSGYIVIGGFGKGSGDGMGSTINLGYGYGE